MKRMSFLVGNSIVANNMMRCERNVSELFSVCCFSGLCVFVFVFFLLLRLQFNFNGDEEQERERDMVDGCG